MRATVTLNAEDTKSFIKARDALGMMGVPPAIVVRMMLMVRVDQILIRYSGKKGKS